MKIVDSALALWKAGWSVLPIPREQKAPILPGWQSLRLRNEAEVRSHFNELLNIGVLNGEPSGDRVDCDLDCFEAVTLAPSFLPPTATWGREHSPKSHWVYHCRDGSPATRKFALAETEGGTVCELRSTGSQTVAPGSTYAGEGGTGQWKGEAIRWDSEQQIPADIERKVLLQQMGKLAAAALLLRNWENGVRDELAAGICGALVHAGWAADDVDDFVKIIAQAAGDKEWRERQKAQSMTRRQRLPGWPKLASLLSKPKVDAIRIWLLHADAERTTNADRRPQIELLIGADALMVETLGNALVTTGAQYYRRDSRLMCVQDYDVKVEGGQRTERTYLALAGHERMNYDITRNINMVRFYKEQFVPVSTPQALTRTMIAAAPALAMFPELSALSCVPLMRADGSLHTERGYDPVSKVFFDPRTEDYSALNVPNQPHAKQVEVALVTLQELLQDFPFSDEESKSVALSAMLTAVMRATLPTTPVFGFSAPSFGAGKSLLAYCIGYLALGYRPQIMNVNPDTEEMGKQLDSVLLAADPVMILDNVSKPLGGDKIAAVITAQGEIGIRLFGTQVKQPAHNTTLWIVTGRNLILKEDMVRRTLICEIDPNCEHPELRTEFKINNLLHWTQQNRVRLLNAVYTLLRAHIQAGRPTDGTTLGTFEEWHLWCCAPLLWCELPSPTARQLTALTLDPEHAMTEEVFNALADVFNRRDDRRITVSRINKALSDASNFSPEIVNLTAAMQQFVLHSGTVDQRRLGRWLGQHHNSIAAGWKLVRSLGSTHDAPGSSAWLLQPHD